MAPRLSTLSRLALASVSKMPKNLKDFLAHASVLASIIVLAMTTVMVFAFAGMVVVESGLWWAPALGIALASATLIWDSLVSVPGD